MIAIHRDQSSFIILISFVIMIIIVVVDVVDVVINPYTTVHSTVPGHGPELQCPFSTDWGTLCEPCVKEEELCARLENCTRCNDHNPAAICAECPRDRFGMHCENDGEEAGVPGENPRRSARMKGATYEKEKFFTSEWDSNLTSRIVRHATLPTSA
nr:hypothetical protein BaRGS_006021 [Batillaria attramentaria]